MKISKIFHSLYYMVMLLPLLIIPIFAININQKSVEPISIEVQQNKKINFNQQYNEDTQTTIISGSTTLTYNLNNGEISYTTDPTLSNYYWNTIINPTNTLLEGHKYFIYVPIASTPSNIASVRFTSSSVTGSTSLINTNNGYHYYYNTPSQDLESCRFIVYLTDKTIVTTINVSFNVFDMTYMYGAGNEPSYTEFLQNFPNNYYEYTLNTQMVVNDYLNTYDNTDIGSQFLYSLYKPVHDYFNFGQYFGLNGVYDWFQVNWFNGTAPLTFFIFYNLMIYWLIISLLWLLFDVLIYVPLLIHKWLDKAAIE